MSALANEDPFVLDEGADGVGELCPACSKMLDVGDSVIACPRCKTNHHETCWHERGCARLGCPHIATRVTERDGPRITDDDRAKEYIKPVPKWVPWTVGFLVFFVMIGVPVLKKYVFADPRPKLTVMLPSGTDEALVNTVAEHYASFNTDIQVEVILGPAGDLYLQKLMIMIGARDAPDIFLLSYPNFATLALQGAYYDLSEWVDSNPESLRDLPDERLRRGQIDGVWYGVPHPSRPLYFGVFARSAMADRATELLDAVIAALPVDESVEDRFTPNQLPPTLHVVPGW